MDEITIYEKPTCSTCRAAVSLLDASGKPFKRVRYHDEPLTKEQLRALVAKLGMRPFEIVRTKEERYKQLEIDAAAMPDDAVLDLLAEHPELMERPILEYGDRAVLGRPTERVAAFLREISGTAGWGLFMNAVYTIGHSTRPLPEFVEILKAYGVGMLADVRTVPRSRHVPQYNLDTLPAALGQEGISHCYLERLGGLRKTSKESPNLGWRNKSFRGYADYMQTEEFRKGIDELLALAVEGTVAIMCAEAVPWRCHRSLIGDALLVRGIEVLDIFSATKAVPEKMTSFAKVDGLEITYPAYEEAA